MVSFYETESEGKAGLGQLYSLEFYKCLIFFNCNSVPAKLCMLYIALIEIGHRKTYIYNDFDSISLQQPQRRNISLS